MKDNNLTAQTPDFKMPKKFFSLFITLLLLVFFTTTNSIYITLKLKGIQQNINLDIASPNRVEQGPSIGSQWPSLLLYDQNSNPIKINNNKDGTLIVFINEFCKPCKTLLPHLKTFAMSNPNIKITLISDSDPLANTKIVKDYDLDFQLLSASPEQWRELKVTATPCAFYLNNQGEIIQKGIPNDLGDLKSLIYNTKK